MREKREIVIVGSGFAGSLIARVLATLGRDVVLFERGSHPRFAIGESTTPLANLSLERLARRYGLHDCGSLAAHGRWTRRHPELRRGLKRGFTFYRHHPGAPLDPRERLLVAASPEDEVADTHWMRADVDHHFVRAAIAAGVDYRDRTTLDSATITNHGVQLDGARDGVPFGIDAEFVIDASGPAGFLARQLAIPSALDATHTRSALLYTHVSGVRAMPDVAPGMPAGPYHDDDAAVHHVIDEGWMYALRFDHGVTSAGFLLTPDGLTALGGADDPAALWARLLARYPTIGDAYRGATPLMPVEFVPRVQHRLAQAAGPRWAMLPHAFAFVDALFSTGIAWGLRAVERLGLAFEEAGPGAVPNAATLARYDALLAAEGTQIDTLVAGSYVAMRDFDQFAAHAMLYFAIVSFAEVRQRLGEAPDVAWQGFLGIGDPVAEPLPGEALARLRDGDDNFAEWVARAIAPRNVAGLADPVCHNLYPVDLDVLIDRHALLGFDRDALVARLPALRGMSPAPEW